MRFAPDLVLRNFAEYENGQKKKEACIPKDLKACETYDFLKNGQRAYWLEGEQPLLEKSENGDISKPLASVIILEVRHFMENNKIFSAGKYKVIKVLTKNEVYFNGCEPIKK